MSPPPGRPRTLLVTPYPPTPPLGGGRRRQLELLKWLASRTEVTLATVVFGPSDEEALSSLVPAGVRLLTGRPLRGALTPRLPLALQWCWSAKLAGLIEDEHGANPFEAAVMSHSYAFVYAESLRIPRIVDAQNMESRLFEQFAGLKLRERARIRRLAGRAGLGFVAAGRSGAQIGRLERRVWREADAVLCVSRKEQSLIGEVAGTRSLYAPNCPSERGGQGPGSRPDRPTVSFAGSLDYIPNIDAVIILADQVAPRLKNLVPDVRILAAGRRPTGRLIRYCRERDVEVIADPVSMSEVVEGSVAASPVRLVGGTRLKILDARSQGLPVVATTSAVEGLELDSDPGVIIADDLDEFALALAELLRGAPVGVRPPSQLSWDQVWEPLGSVLGLGQPRVGEPGDAI